MNQKIWELTMPDEEYIIISENIQDKRYVTKIAIRHLPHHHGISMAFQCQPVVDLG